MATTLRKPVSHEDRLSLTEHLDELRSRLIVCVLTLVVAFGITFWQGDNILSWINKPLEQTQNLEGNEKSNDPLEQNARFQTRTGEAFRAQAKTSRPARPATAPRARGRRAARERA